MLSFVLHQYFPQMTFVFPKVKFKYRFDWQTDIKSHKADKKKWEKLSFSLSFFANNFPNNKNWRKWRKKVCVKANKEFLSQPGVILKTFWMVKASKHCTIVKTISNYKRAETFSCNELSLLKAYWSFSLFNLLIMFQLKDVININQQKMLTHLFK